MFSDGTGLESAIFALSNGLVLVDRLESIPTSVKTTQPFISKCEISGALMPTIPTLNGFFNSTVSPK